MNEEIKRDEEKLKFLAINELKKESDDFNLLYQKHRRMLDAYEKLPETLQLREYDKPMRTRLKANCTFFGKRLRNKSLRLCLRRRNDKRNYGNVKPV